MNAELVAISPQTHEKNAEVKKKQRLWGSSVERDPCELRGRFFGARMLRPDRRRQEENLDWEKKCAGWPSLFTDVKS